MLLACAHCHEPIQADRLHEHFVELHPEWCVGTPEWEDRLAREYDFQFINRLGITPEEYDRRFLKLMGIEPPVVSESNP